MVRVAVLASGRGSNLEALLRAQASGGLGPARIALVVSDRADARALAIATEHRVEAVHLDPGGIEREHYDEAMVARLNEAGIELVVLAGFMRILTRTLVEAFPERIINIHPSLLPAFQGLDAQGQAVEHGVRYAGATTHLVTEAVDEGPIVLQAVVPVHPDDSRDTLARRILAEEHRILPETVRLAAEDRLVVSGRHVTIADEKALRRPPIPGMVSS